MWSQLGGRARRVARSGPFGWGSEVFEGERELGLSEGGLGS